VESLLEAIQPVFKIGRLILRESAVTLARVIRFVEIADLLSGARISLSELIQRTAERYAFEKFPKSFEESDLKDKGIEFFEGNSEFGPIQKFGIFNTGLVLDTRLDTGISQHILSDITMWGEKDLGINNVPQSMQFAYVSDVTFYSEVPLLRTHPAVSALADKVSELISQIWGEPIFYSPVAMAIGHDPLTRKNQIAQFRIERRSEAKFSENKYFSEAPLPTVIHWQLLEEYEKNISEHGV
jgi:hypothetical protein